jgi:hypothetical protein
MFADISKPSASSYALILISVICVDLIVLFLVRYNPDFFGKPINDWYNDFDLNAVISDVLIIVLGFLITQILYGLLVRPTIGFNLLVFAAMACAIQLVHDLLFHFFVVEPIPKGHNGMIDVFKRYDAAGSYKILIADSSMMIGSAVIASFLASQPVIVPFFVGTLAVYAIPYILSTRNKFSKN